MTLMARRFGLSVVTVGVLLSEDLHFSLSSELCSVVSEHPTVQKIAEFPLAPMGLSSMAYLYMYPSRLQIEKDLGRQK